MLNQSDIMLQVDLNTHVDLKSSTRSVDNRGRPPRVRICMYLPRLIPAQVFLVRAVPLVHIKMSALVLHFSAPGSAGT